MTDQPLWIPNPEGRNRTRALDGGGEESDVDMTSSRDERAGRRNAVQTAKQQVKPVAEPEDDEADEDYEEPEDEDDDGGGDEVA